MIVTLKNEQLTVTVDTLGAQLQTITGQNGIEYLWYGDPTYWKGRAPHLFPTVGKLRDCKATCARGEINLPQHGLARISEFTLEESTETSATFLLESNGKTLTQYPYRFAFRVTYTLESATLSTTYTVTNTDTDVMPFGIGGHPGFNVPLVEGECFEDYAIELELAETLACPCVDMGHGLIDDRNRNRMLHESNRFSLHYPLFRGDALIFDRAKSRKIRLVSDKSGHGVEMAFADFPIMAIWTPTVDSPFVCLEPWVTMATQLSEDDVFEHKLNIQSAQPGESKAYTYTITMF